MLPDDIDMMSVARGSFEIDGVCSQCNIGKCELPFNVCQQERNSAIDENITMAPGMVLEQVELVVIGTFQIS